MSLEALIFDVDGTLADTEEAHRLAFNRAFEHFRLGWHWSQGAYRDLLETTGGKERIAAYLATQSLSSAERKRLAEMIPAIHAEKTKAYGALVAEGAVPLRLGVARLLDEALAAGCRLAIASTTTAANVDALLGAALGPRGIEMFSVIACGDQVPAKKPAPDVYELVLHHLGVDAEQAVALEDSRNGLLAATRAGLWTVVTPNFWTEHHDFSEAGLLLPDLAALSYAELARLGDRRPRSDIARLYEGAHG